MIIEGVCCLFDFTQKMEIHVMREMIYKQLVAV